MRPLRWWYAEFRRKQVTIVALVKTGMSRTGFGKRRLRLCPETGVLFSCDLRDEIGGAVSRIQHPAQNSLWAGSRIQRRELGHVQAACTLARAGVEFTTASLPACLP
jgi:hypothetical protein